MKPTQIQIVIERVLAGLAAALFVGTIVAFLFYVSMLSVITVALIGIGLLMVYGLGVCTGSGRQIRLLQRLRRAHPSGAA